MNSRVIQQVEVIFLMKYPAVLWFDIQVSQVVIVGSSGAVQAH